MFDGIHNRRSVIAIFTLWILLFACQFCITGCGGSKKDILHGQILMNTSCTTITSPSSHDRAAWSAGWIENWTVPSLVVAVHIDESLLQAAVEYQLGGEDRVTKSRALSELRQRFLRPKQRAYLIIAKPIIVDWNSTMWKLHLGPIKKNAELIPLRGKDDAGQVIEAELGLDEELIASDRPPSALVFFADPVEENDPSVTLQIKNIHHSIQKRNGEWAKSDYAQTMNIRFETSTVQLLSLMEDGTSWADLESKYLDPRRETLFPNVRREHVNQLLSFAIDLAVSRLTKKK